MGLCVDDFLAQCAFRNLSQNTIEQYRNALRRFAKFTQACELDWRKPIAIRQFLGGLTNAGRSPTTIRYYYAILSAYYQYIVNEGLLETNPMLRIPKPQQPSKHPRSLDDIQIRRFLKAFDPNTYAGKRDRFLCLLALGAGLRLGEIVGLKLDSINTAAAVVTVTGKGDKQRTIPMGWFLIKEYERYLSDVRERMGDHTDALFLNRMGEPVKEEVVMRLFRRASKRAGIKVSCHMLRHTYATRFIRNGGKVTALKELLGHESINTTMTYVHITAKELEAEVCRADPLRGFEFLGV